MTRTKEKAEYGDFQTPVELARVACALLAEQGLRPAAMLEPTCGIGNFLFAGLDQLKTIQEAVGVDINAEYIERARASLQKRNDRGKVNLIQGNFFTTDWKHLIGELPEPILVLGNPPWVTNAHLAVLGSQNLPVKSNFQKHRGLDAITGKANFDISEWMLLRLFEAISGRRGALAMLCKASTARKVLCHAWRTGIPLGEAAIYGIDADRHFDAAVDAVLLVAHFRQSADKLEAKVYDRLGNAGAPRTIGFEDGVLLADVAAYHDWRHLHGEASLKWRSGIKHDCAKVMELCREGGRYRNGLNELAEIEDLYLYPMLKSSSIGRRDVGTGNRFMLVTQTTVREQTDDIRERAPRTWAYLQSHADLLNRRASSIYRKRPPFSVFGVGGYSFAPWKLAISGFYKKLAFVFVGPRGGKPVVLDDTSYFIACQTRGEAEYLACLLNSSVAKSFFGAFVFWDSKRPITADLLRRLDLRRLAKEVGSLGTFDSFFGAPVSGAPMGATGRRGRHGKQLGFWPA
jgi:hypothetical protein